MLDLHVILSLHQHDNGNDTKTLQELLTCLEDKRSHASAAEVELQFADREVGHNLIKMWVSTTMLLKHGATHKERSPTSIVFGWQRCETCPAFLFMFTIAGV